MQTLSCQWYTHHDSVVRHFMQEAGSEVDSHGITRLPLRREGWNFWEWEGRKIHYITAGRPQAVHELTGSFVYVS